MGLWTTLLLAAALAVAVGVTIAAFRHPILARMATRNALRRPKQTSTVIAGLMVGTAIISAALIAGDSAGYAIRGYVYQSLGHIDESVALEGYPYFPESVYEELRTDPAVADFFDGISAHAIWEGAVENPRTDLYEPSIALIGTEPDRDADFGPFNLRGGGRTDGRGLDRGEAIATGHLASSLDLQVGDELKVTYTRPVDPLLPDITFANGTVTAAFRPTLPGLPPVAVEPEPEVHPFDVNASATRLFVVVGWDPSSQSDLRIVATEPDGTEHEGTQVPGQPAAQIDLAVPAGETLTDGTWTLTVTSEAAVNVDYAGIIAVATPVYDLALLRERAEALQRDFGDFDELRDRFSPYNDPEETSFRVIAITTGGRGDLFDFRDALFIHIDEAQSLFDRPEEVNLVKFSNPGGVEGGVGETAEAIRVLNATLDQIKEENPDIASIQSLEVMPLKRDFLEVADDTGATLTGLLVFAGSLSIITGLLLILNIFTMLAEERRSELGMARAVGLQRGDLVRLFLFEGSLYAVVAAAMGAILGLGLASAMIWVMNTIIGNLSPDLSFPPIPFRPTLSAIFMAFSVGVLLTFATIYQASRSASRLNVVRAIRRIDEPDKHGHRIRDPAIGAPLALVGLIANVLGTLGVESVVGAYGFSFQVFGALAAVVGLGIALRPWISRRHLLPGLAASLAAYYTLTYFFITKYENVTEANVVGPIRGVILTLCVVVLVVHFDVAIRLLGRGLARMKRLRAVAVPAVAYPLHRKFRTGMTLAMFSVVILSIGFFSIFGALFQTDPSRQTGGFDIEARTTLTVEDLDEYDQGELDPDSIRDRQHLVDYATEDPDFLTVSGGRTGTFGDFLHNVYGYDAAFAQAQDFRLLFRDEAYPDDKAAYQAVLASDDLVIVSYQYSTDSRNRDLANEVGDTLVMHLGEESIEYRIVGIQEQYHFPGIFLPKETVRGLFPTVEDLYLYRVAAGHDAGDVAKDLERNYREVGMDAEDSIALVVEEQESFRQVLGAMKLFLGLGLIVGVLSLGIITSRSVLERRQEIGMLRALGYTGGQVRLLFFIEVTLTLMLGALVGVACAILVTFGLWYAIIRDLNYPYDIPWGEVGLLLLVSYIVALLATMAPIRRSAKVAPAEALRYIE